MEQKLYDLYRYNDLRVLYDDGKLALDDIWAEDWLVIQAIILEDNIYRTELKEQEQRLKNDPAFNKFKL
jgi:hypothetical protein